MSKFVCVATDLEAATKPLNGADLDSSFVNPIFKDTLDEILTVGLEEQCEYLRTHHNIQLDAKKLIIPNVNEVRHAYGDSGKFLYKWDFRHGNKTVVITIENRF